MLLRSSRVAGHMTKEALVGKAVGNLAAKGLAAVGRNPMKVLGGAMVVGATAPTVSKAVHRATTGLQPQYLEAANAGFVPSVPQA